MLATFRSVLLVSSLATLSKCSSSDRYNTFPFFDPVLDAGEALSTSSGDDPPYVPIFPDGYVIEAQRAIPHSDRIIAQGVGPLVQDEPLPDHPHQRYQHLIDQMSPFHLEGHTVEADGASSSVGEIVDRDALSKTEARQRFLSTAQAMQTGIQMPRLLHKFRHHLTPLLMNELLSDDHRHQQRATSSILMHRPTALRFFDQYYEDQLPKGPIYKDFTKEEILARIFDLMGVSPVEDMRLWWYDRIIYHSRKDDFNDLYSNDPVRQEAAISNMSGLTRKGYIWVQERQRRSVGSHAGSS